MNFLQLNKRRKEESLSPPLSDFFINMQERGLYKENEIKKISLLKKEALRKL